MTGVASARRRFLYPVRSGEYVRIEPPKGWRIGAKIVVIALDVGCDVRTVVVETIVVDEREAVAQIAECEAVPPISLKIVVAWVKYSDTVHAFPTIAFISLLARSITRFGLYATCSF